MKKCRRCSKPATLHITEIRKGEVQQLHLCEVCAQKYLAQGNPDSEDSSPDMNVEELEASDELACPHCGITFRQFRSQGRLGCPHDYEVFETELNQLLENIHDGAQHCGKVPLQTGEANQDHFRLIKLRSELQVAVKDEAYEKAAALRDEIQQIESRIRTQTTA
ncbi:MAG: UvrB/UvrC motif-containing protein [Planctomycetia bacterium]|nr:UvrB/UvrC motif-containing protein [Planctomycetia bacterium]